jgi:glutamate synthase (NADPH/NADH) small chain
MPKPPVGRSETTPLALLAIAIKNILFTSGCDRNWLINTKEFISNEKEN